MKQSQLFTKIFKEAPADAEAINAKLLLRAGYIDQLTAGVYTYLPLGLRVLRKIQNIIREEMNAIGGQEVLMPALTPKKVWQDTGRWDEIDVLFRLKGAGGKEYALAATAEDVVTPLVKKFASSYKDFPIFVYQISDKFRNEPRAKAGILRGREFNMKDLYSFHLSEEDFVNFYEKIKEAYLRIYNRCGLEVMIAKASGGDFTKRFSHEFQVVTPAGEDEIYIDKSAGEILNKEIVPENEWGNLDKYEIKKTIEVGNIFPLESKFTDAIGYTAIGQDNQPCKVIMGSYGIGPSRVMGAIVEVHHDDKGIVWPKSVAPYQVHLLSLNGKGEEMKSVFHFAESIYQDLKNAGIEVLWDDREDVSAGMKFAEADLLGLPLRLVISAKTIEKQAVEWKERNKNDVYFVSSDKLIDRVKDWLDA